MNKFDALLVVLVLYGAIAWDLWGRKLISATKKEEESRNSSLLNPSGIHPDQCKMDTRITGVISPIMSASSRRKGFARSAAQDTEASEQAGASSSTVRTTITLSRTAGPRT
jgi:hypothetical protein